MTLAWLGLSALASLSAGSFSEVMTLEEFETYLRSKLPDLTVEMADRISLMVDLNADGEIDDEEFKDRMAAVRKVRSSGAPGSAPAKPVVKPVVMADYMDGDAVSSAPLTATDRAELLLLTGGDLAAAWGPFAEWKTRQGQVAKVMTVREIARRYQGPTIQEKIRLCVMEHVEKHGTRSVLLGGDCHPGGGVVPGGPLTFHDLEPEGIPTDLIYVSATGWDADGDGRHGEWKDDAEAISYPDGRVSIGRVPVRTAEDVAAYTAKVVAYEANYPVDGFAEQMLFTSADKNSSLKVKRAWDGYLKLAWNGGIKRLFAGEMPGDDGSATLSSDALVGAFNAKDSGKMHIHGHGFLDQWILEDSKFQAQDVARLDNEGAYPVVTTVSCNTGEFDSGSDPSIVESMIRQPLAGAVAVVAPIRRGKMHFHERGDYDLMLSEGKLDGSTMLLTRFWIHAAGEYHSTGEALAAARRDLAADAKKSSGFHLCISEFNLLGDPTLRVHAGAPRTPKILKHTKPRVGEALLEFETDAPGATLCVWKGQEIYETLELDERGQGEVNVNIKTPGDLLVTLSGVGLNVVSQTVAVPGD